MVRFTELSAARRGARRKLAAAHQGATRTSILATVIGIDPEDGSRLLVSVDPADPDLSVLAGPTKVVPGALVHVEVDSAGRPIRVLGPASTRPEGLDEDAPAPAPIVPMEPLAPRELSEAEAQAIRETADGLAEAQGRVDAAEGLLNAIGAADGPDGVADAISDYLAIPLDQITVVDNRGADGNVIANLYDAIIVEGLLTASGVITKDLIATGAIESRHLNVVPEEGTGGMELKPEGLRIIPADSGEGTAINLRSDEENWISFARDGESTFSVSPAGELTAQTVDARDSFQYRGVELEDLIPQPGDVLARVLLSRNLLSDGRWALLSSATFTVQSGRLYRAYATYSARSSTQQPAQVAIKFSGQSGFKRSWGIPTWHTDNGAGSAGTLVYEFEAADSGTGVVTLEFYGRSRLSGKQVAFNGWNSWETDMSTACGLTVEDRGSRALAGLVMDQGVQPVLDGGATSAPPTTSPPKPTTYTKTYAPTWHRSFLGNGNHYNYNSHLLYHGRYLAQNGILKSMVGFNTAQIQADLAGATIKKIEYRLVNAGTNLASGATISVGLHGATSAPGTFSEATNDWSVVKFNRGQARWISAPVNGGFATGARTGITLNPGSDSSTNRYAYFKGAETRLRITYEK